MMYYPDVPALEPDELELLCHEYLEHNATLDPHLADQMGVKRGLRNLDGTGVLAGIILAIGRIVGETAALLYTAGTQAQIPSTPMESGRTLALHMYVLSGEGLHTDEAFATAVVLLVLVVGINALSAFLARRISKGG